MLTQALILCGGLGTRLGDITRETPKPLLPVGDRPFLDHLIQEVSRFGVDEIVLLAGRFGEKVRDAYDGRKINRTTARVLVEPRPLGTGGALRFAEDALMDEFLVLNGDSWIDADLVQAGVQWKRLSADVPDMTALMLLRQVADARRYGSVRWKDGLVTGFSEKRDGGEARPDLVNAGVYILRKALVSALPPDEEISLERNVFPGVVQDGRMAGHVVSASSYFIDIGVPDDYRRAQTELPAARTRPALFLYCDGLFDGDDNAPDRLGWLPGAREAVRLANDRGHYVFLITSRATGAACGSSGPAEALQRAIQTDLSRIGAHVDGFSGVPDREPGFARTDTAGDQLKRAWTSTIDNVLAAWPVNAARSIVVGRAESQVEAGRVAGLRTAIHCGTSLADLVASLLAD